MYTPNLIPQDINQLSSYLSLELNNISNADFDWSKITSGTPTTVQGYGITNAARTDAVPTFAGGVTGSEGGEIHLAKAASGGLSYDTIIDILGTNLRIFEGGGSTRGCYIDLADCGNSATTNLLTPAWSNVTGKPTSPASGNWFSGGYPVINASNGVMEIGRYIDFHSTDASTADYTFRIDNYSDGNLTLSGNIYVGGTLTTGSVIYPMESSGQMSVTTSGTKGLEIRSDGGATSASYISFHRPGSYAVHFGLGTNNKLSVGGWSLGNVQYEIFHSGNLPTYFPKSASTNGYQELPTGIIIQWGQATSSGTAANNCAVTLPTSVSTALYSATAVIAGTSAAAYLVLVSASTTSTVTFSVSNGAGSYLSGISIRWMAIGY
ncbi:gp53-like domain-containing protein [Methylobacter sp. sgz302048]|uniref:gp53-like domain-containing protein n=1 Tax=Methylobacter sp. sgz302048 TaxID=3455945 RepID=UPI003FA193F3